MRHNTATIHSLLSALLAFSASCTGDGRLSHPVHKVGCIPARGEPAHVFCLQQPYSEIVFSPEYAPWKGEHLSPNESSVKRFRFLDFDTGVAADWLSRRYAPIACPIVLPILTQPL